MEIFLAIIAIAALWYFLRQRRAPAPNSPLSAPDPNSGWDRSESGNPIIHRGDLRLTVFRHTKGHSAKGGWKFCIAEGDDDESPYFSGEYQSEDEAKYEGLAKLDGLPSKYDALTRRDYETVHETHARFLRNATIDTEALITATTEAVASPDNKVTDLRKLEKRLETKLKQFSQIGADFRSLNDDVRAARSREMEERVNESLESIRDRIDWLKLPKSQREQT